MDSINTPVDEYEKQLEAGIGGEESQTVETKKRKTKASTSDCWKFFTKIAPDKDGKEMARCNACKTEYRIGGHQYGTSHLKRHIEKCKEIKFEDVGQMILDMKGKLKSRMIDQMVLREMLAATIICHDLPFKYAEYQKVRNWMKYLNPDAIPISRNTAKADVLSIYKREKAKLKEEMTIIPSRISLTSDLWTAVTTEGYICLTAHFVDTNWKLNSKILNFCHMPPPHTGFELSKKINEFLVDWGLEKKIFSLTLDNASSNDILQETLKSQLVMQNWLLCDGEFFHVRCSAHILNLIVQEGLKIASDALHKIRESIKYVRGSESRMKKFKECIERIGDIDASSGLRLDVSTRWNSTYMMLESALKYQRVFANLHWNDDNYKFCPSVEEWKRGEKICRFLLPFYDMTNLISGSSYRTSNLYFVQVWKIQCVLIDGLSDEDEVVRSMAERMVPKFQKYWDEYSVVLAFGAILDPRIKLSTLSYCYSKTDESTSDMKLEHVKRKLYMLFSQYSAKSTTSNVPRTIHATSSSSSMPKDPKPSSSRAGIFDEFKMHRHQVATKTGKSQLDVYLDEAALDFDELEHMDVLRWWKDNRKRFSELSIMARDLLSIPITTVASESAFSIGSRILNKYRSRLLSKNVEALICTRNWLHGFNDDGEDDSDEDDDKHEKVGMSSSKGASNVINLEEQ